VNDTYVKLALKEGYRARAAYKLKEIDETLGLIRPGHLVVKVFHGSGYSQIVKMFKETFKVVKPIKPKSSRDKSSETFLVGMGLIHGV
jgi:23S rRNA U2552 (ribose-2'-O)-methylase RlmE/FtsJ